MHSAAAARISARVRCFFFSRREFNIPNGKQSARRLGTWGRHYCTPTGRRQRLPVWQAVLFAAFVGPGAHADGEVTAQSLIEGSLDLTRGTSSYTEMTMTVRRPSGERKLSLVAWTRGREDALIRFTAPAKDAGAATLKKGEQMWSYAPKIGREIRLPSSRMSQQWAGSDFSYNDLSRTDKYLRHYDIAIVGTEERDGHTVYTLDMIPHDNAPVVWGKETLELRDDYVILSQTFYDQSQKPLKRMETVEIGELGGRVIPLAMRISPTDKDDRWTEIRYHSADFDADVDDSRFTTFALRGGR